MQRVKSEKNMESDFVFESSSVRFEFEYKRTIFAAV